MTDEAHPDALPAGYRLHWYVIEEVLGQGGFGITYLANDTNLDRRVAIKEYLPTEIARRRSDASARPHTESHSERFAWGLERFLAEARTLARFDHPNIVRVHSVFEANNSAYMVMRFEDGENLARLLARCTTLSERQLTDCLLPILDGLQLVHAAGFIHRDIKPENIYVRQDGSPVLLDFGSARQSFGTAKTMTILVAPGYAPLEQYYGDAATQGAWTDIYGLGATCYRAIAGRPPLDAVVRAKGVLGSAREVLPSAVEVGGDRYDGRLLAAIDHALQLNERDRPQTLADWRRELVAPLALPVAGVSAALPPPAQVQAPPMMAAAAAVASMQRSPRRRAGLATTAAVAVGALGSAVWFWPSRTSTIAQASPTQPLSSPASAVLAIAKVEPPQALAAPVVPPAASVAAPAALVTAPVAAPKIAAALPPANRSPEPRESRVQPLQPAPRVVALPAQIAALLPAPVSTELAPPTPAPMALASAPVVTARAVPDDATPRSARNEQIDAAEAAMGRGDHAAAAQQLAPLAAAGVARAQALLGRVQEARAGTQRNDFEAYIWYGLAARGGQAGAQAMKDKVATKLQPAEIRQADQIVERWRPQAESH